MEKSGMRRPDFFVFYKSVALNSNEMYPSFKVHGSKLVLNVRYEDQLTVDSRCVGAEKHPRYATLWDML